MSALNILLHKLLKPTKQKRVLFFLICDVLIIAFSFYAAFYLRFGFTFPERYREPFGYWLIGLLIVKIAALAVAGLYNINWRFVGLTEMLSLIKVASVLTVAIFAVNILFIREEFPNYDLPRGIVIIEAFLSFISMGIVRIAKRIAMLVLNGGRIGKKSLIIGADFTGERLIRELVSSSREKAIPVAIVDDDPMRIGTRISGIPVLGGTDRLAEIVGEHKIETVLINLPRASHQKIARLFNILRPLGVSDIKVVPRIDDYDSDILHAKSFKQLDIQDLLSRESVLIDSEKIDAYIKGKVVLVTGAAGSIGSEILRQLLAFGAGRVVGLEIDETEIFNLDREIRPQVPKEQVLDFVVGDVRDKAKLDRVFARYKPEVVFHAAAYKHVPMMEHFPEEAVKTNVFGTRNLVEAALAHGCKKMVNISTDKAVNPTSVMGASKRLAEMICIAYSSPQTRIVSVRFGNVLGSRGSVVPIFLDQIKNGGPIRVTHKDMRRYFMSVPEAVVLVMQAASMGTGGEVFVLDMGEPVKIVKLAETLIHLNNLEPYRDIQIEFTGLRPGEKLFEEVLTAEEGTAVTTHEKIFVAKKTPGPGSERIASMIEELKACLADQEELKRVLRQHVPLYKQN